MFDIMLDACVCELGGALRWGYGGGGHVRVSTDKERHRRLSIRKKDG